MQSGEPLQIPLHRIIPNARQPRSRFDMERLQALADSIEEQGLLQPVVVRPGREAGYELVAGERRFRACEVLGFETLPAVVVRVSDERMLETALVENLQREDLNPIEIGLAFRSMMEDLGLTHEEVADRVGTSRATVTNTLRLLQLPDEVRQMVANNAIRAGHARVLAGLEDAEAQLAIARRIVTDDLSVRATERLVREASGKGASGSRRGSGGPTRGDDSASAVIRDYEDRLRQQLGTKVEIRDAGGKGEIRLHYFSDAEFAKLVETLGIDL